MAYKQKPSPFKQTTGDYINVTKTTSKHNKKKKSSPLDGMVKMPWDGKQAKMVKLPGKAGDNAKMVKF
jgi:hypothetical protein